jgi:hypothetical protein
MGRGADIPRGVVEDEVFEMDELAVDPQGGTGVGEILPLEKAGADWGARNALVETGQGDRCGFCFVVSNQKMSFAC